MKNYTHDEAVRLFKIATLKEHRAIMNEFNVCSIFKHGNVHGTDQINKYPSHVKVDSIFYYAEHMPANNICDSDKLFTRIYKGLFSKRSHGGHESMLIGVDALMEAQGYDGGKMVGTYKFNEMFLEKANIVRRPQKEDMDVYVLKSEARDE